MFQTRYYDNESNNESKKTLNEQDAKVYKIKPTSRLIKTQKHKVIYFFNVCFYFTKMIFTAIT